MITRLLSFPVAAIAALPGIAAAVPATPYAPDAHTLHLWHLNEKSPPFRDEGSPATPLLGLLNGAVAGESSLPGFEKSISFHHETGGTPGTPDLKGAILLAAPQLAYGPEDNVPEPFAFTGPDGAFTFEALVKLDITPAEAQVIALGIISMDGDSNERVFNFRIEKEGFLSFIPLSSIGAAGGALATIPTTGPDAIGTGGWFHVAVTYDGNEGVPNNLKLYWTRVRHGLREANRIGQGTLPADLKSDRGDFAIGNEARQFPTNAESEPFPGKIDEVRISSVARDPSDFLFVPSEHRRPPDLGNPNAATAAKGPIQLHLSRILVNEHPVSGPAPGRPLELPSGLHRLDFDFEVLLDNLVSPSHIRRQLTGLDDRWQESAQGMLLLVEILGENDTIMARAEFPAIGSSPGWETSLDDSRYTPRQEAVFVPAGARFIRLTLSSGSPDTTGFMAIDQLDLLAPRPSGELRSLWFNTSFAEGENLGTSGGKPTGWERSGPNPAIARITIETTDPALALVDADQANGAAWVATAPLPEDLGEDSTLILKWQEAFNVIGGKLHRATYVNVPSGSYTFRAIAPSDDGESVASLAVPFLIRPPFWERPWFWPVVAASGVAAVAGLILALFRRKSRRRLVALRLQKVLADDRARIARDMHDDLGTRITLMTMNSALVERDMAQDPERARSHLHRLNHSARNLVTAMDDLVWAVDPANDTLNHLGIHIARTVEEMFRDAPIRCRFDIPAVLPKIPLGSDFRHHVALAVKECLHNILRHAGPCEAKLVLTFADNTLVVRISDTGCGFDTTLPDSGNGLSNMVKRLEEVHGNCLITSSPGNGTTFVMTCPLPSPSTLKGHV